MSKDSIRVYESEGKKYVSAEDFINKKEQEKETNWNRTVGFPAYEQDWYEHRHNRYSENEENEYLQDDIRALSEAEENVNEAIEDKYKIAFQLNDSDIPVGDVPTEDLSFVSSAMKFINVDTNEIVNADVVLNEYVEKMLEEIDADVFFDEDSLYNSLLKDVEKINADNKETALLIASGVKKDDVRNFISDYIKENALDNETGGLKGDFRNIVDEYDRIVQRGFGTSDVAFTVAFKILNDDNNTFLDDLQEKMNELQQGTAVFEDYGRFRDFARNELFSVSVERDMKGILQEAFDVEKYDIREGGNILKNEDGRRFVTLSDYLKENTNNQQFQTAITGAEDYDLLVEVDRHNKVIDIPLDEKELADRQLYVVSESSPVRNANEVFDDATIELFKKDVAETVAKAEYKDLSHLEKMVELFIADKVIDRQNNCLNPEFMPELVLPSEALDKIKEEIMKKADDKHSLLCSWVNTYAGFGKERAFFRENENLLLSPCVDVAIEARKDDLLQAYKNLNAERFDVSNARVDVLMNYIDNEILDKEEERLNPEIRNKFFADIAFCDEESFINQIGTILAESPLSTEEAVFAECTDTELENCIVIALTKKNDDLCHAFEMEKIYEEIRDEIPEIENHEDKQDMDLPF